jgi:hypothetical protein
LGVDLTMVLGLLYTTIARTPHQKFPHPAFQGSRGGCVDSSEVSRMAM